MALWRTIVRQGLGGSRQLWETSDLVYDPNIGDETEGNLFGKQAHMIPDEDHHGRDRIVLRLNGDGKLSHHLWLFCALLHLDEEPNGGAPVLSEAAGAEDENREGWRLNVSHIVRILGEVADLQTRLELEGQEDEGLWRFGLAVK